MTDFAVIDLDNPERSQLNVSATVLAPSNSPSSSVEASISGLRAGLLGIQAKTADISDSRALRRSFGQTNGVVVVNPTLSAKHNRLGRLAFLSFRARLAGKPFALVAVSAFELTTRRSRFFARTIVNHADLVLVRDEASADALMAAGIEAPFRMGADPAWAQLDEIYAAKSPADQVVVAIDVDERETDIFDLEASLSNTLKSLADDLKIVLQPWDEDGRGSTNVLLAKKVAANLNGRATVVAPPKSLREARELYSGSRMVLATRMHAVMAAACAGSRAISLATDPSVERLSDSLAVPTLAATAPTAVMTTAVMEALDGDPATASAVRQHIDRAKGSIELVRLLLTEGTQTAPATIDPLPLYPNPWRP